MIVRGAKQVKGIPLEGEVEKWFEREMAVDGQQQVGFGSGRGLVMSRANLMWDVLMLLRMCWDPVQHTSEPEGRVRMRRKENLSCRVHMECPFVYVTL